MFTDLMLLCVLFLSVSNPNPIIYDQIDLSAVMLNF